ncbi:hypothetical protein [Streptomyces wedmorensis]|uniref:hypothetical protein n=1 Tax=Streptomyces wedmorensis TaxID=43759 RepID=UPI0037B5195B
MSQQDPGADRSRRGRRRHAPARRGPRPAWLIAAGAAGLLGTAAVLLTGASRPGGGSPAQGEPGGPPALIQADPSDGSGPDGEADASAPPAAPGAAPSASATTPSPGPTTTPSGTASAAPDATPTDSATGDPTAHPGRGRGLTKRPR